MWTYIQRSGQLLHDGLVVGNGYSGAGAGKNNPDFEDQCDVGPIPAGMWEICGPPYDTTSHGPFVLRLEPLPGTELYGRAGFLMHGDSIEHPGQASEGCIIQARYVRVAVWDSNDRDLEVLTDPPALKITPNPATGLPTGA